MPPSKRSPAKRPAAKRSPRAAATRRAERERRFLKRRLVLALVVAAALAGYFLVTRADEDATVIDAAEASGVCSYDTGGGYPPVEGPTGANAAPPGFYQRGDEAPSDEALVAAMRRGFVVLWYGTQTDEAALTALSDRLGRDLILVPRPDDALGGQLAVTAWQRRLRCSSVDGDAIAAFVSGFRDRGPEKGFL